MKKSNKIAAKDYKSTYNQTVSGYHGAMHCKNYAYISDRKVSLGDSYEDYLKIVGVMSVEIETVNSLSFLNSNGQWVQNSNMTASIIDAMVNADSSGLPSGLFKYERDCSLSYSGRGSHLLQTGTSGIEIISLPFNLKGFRNCLQGFSYLYETMKKIGMTTADRTCGMHMHLSNNLFGKSEGEQVKNQKKLVLWIQNNYDMAVQLLKRDATATTYCDKVGSGTIEAIKRASSMAGLTSAIGNYHGCFVTHRGNRIEIRLAGGQVDFAGFRNTIETMFQIIKGVCRYSEVQINDNPLIIFNNSNQCVIDRLADVFSPDTIKDSIKKLSEDDFIEHSLMPTAAARRVLRLYE